MIVAVGEEFLPVGERVAGLLDAGGDEFIEGVDRHDDDRQHQQHDEQDDRRRQQIPGKARLLHHFCLLSCGARHSTDRHPGEGCTKSPSAARSAGRVDAQRAAGWGLSGGKCSMIGLNELADVFACEIFPAQTPHPSRVPRATLPAFGGGGRECWLRPSCGQSYAIE